MVGLPLGDEQRGVAEVEPGQVLQLGPDDPGLREDLGDEAAGGQLLG